MYRTLPALAVAFALLACSKPAPPQAPAEDAARAATSATTVVQRRVDAYNARDLEAFLATYADDVTITTASTGVAMVQGKTVLRARYGDLFQKFPQTRVQVAERRSQGDKVVLDREVITGRGPERPDPWDVGWVRYEVEGGLIRRVVLP